MINQAMEGAKMAGASRIIGVDLNPAKYEQGTIFLTEAPGILNIYSAPNLTIIPPLFS
jgi:Zn-dependent alcohol dehydrogenase